MVLAMLLILLTVCIFIFLKFYKTDNILAGVITAGIIIFYCFLSYNAYHPKHFMPSKVLNVYWFAGGFYNWLVMSLKDFNFHLYADPEIIEYVKNLDPELFLKMAPENPAIGMFHDISIYNGKAYLYFGITPALVLYLPFYLLTNMYLSDHIAMIIFVSGSFIFLLLTLRIIKNISHFSIGPAVKIHTILLTGLCSILPFLFMRTAVTELAVAASLFFSFLSILLLLQYLFGTNLNKNIILFFTGLSCSFAVGTKPHNIILLAFIFIILLVHDKFKFNKRTYVKYAAFILPCAVFGTFLAVYNYVRFDSIFEFGVSYQTNDLNMMGWKLKFSEIFIGVKHYFFHLPQIKQNFPYVAFVWPNSQGYNFPQDPMASLAVHFPFILCLLYYPVIFLKIYRQYKEAALVLAMMVSVSVIYLILQSSLGITPRYEADFLCFAVIPSLFVFYWILNEIKNNTVKKIITCSFVVITLISIYVNVNLLFDIDAAMALKEPNWSFYENVIKFLS